MSRVTEVRLVDDIDGSNASETVTFGLDRRQYEMDLSTRNAAKLRAALAPFVASARRSSGRRRSSDGSTTPKSATDRERTAAIRGGPASTATRSPTVGASPPRSSTPTRRRPADQNR